MMKDQAISCALLSPMIMEYGLLQLQGGFLEGQDTPMPYAGAMSCELSTRHMPPSILQWFVQIVQTRIAYRIGALRHINIYS